MESRFIGILPFLSFKDKVIELNEFLIFGDSEINEVRELSESLKQSLKKFSKSQKKFISKTFNNSNSEITFVVPKSSSVEKNQIELFFEILFFYLHKGDKFTYFLSTPNIFCHEDFKTIVIELMDNKNSGNLTIKKKWKFQLNKPLTEFIISPVGCENVVTQYEDYNYLFRNINFDTDDAVLQYLYERLVSDSDSHIIRAITFYNRAMSCELRDEQRFVWLSSALESFLQLGTEDYDKKAKIKKEIDQIIQSKNFSLLDKDQISINVSDLITVIYDYRSSYIHGGDVTTKCQEIEYKMKQKLGKLDFVSALMNLTSYLLMHNLIPDNKFEDILNVLFNNQQVFNKAQKIFITSADKILKEFEKIETQLTIFSFLQCNLQSLSFDKDKIEKCMDNILRIYAKFARDSHNNELAIKIQQKINSIDFKERDRFDKWNSYFSETKEIAPNLNILYLSKSVFQKFYYLREYDTAIY